MGGVVVLQLVPTKHLLARAKLKCRCSPHPPLAAPNTPSCQGPVCGCLIRPGGGVPVQGQGRAGRRLHRAPALRPHAPGVRGHGCCVAGSSTIGCKRVIGMLGAVTLTRHVS